VDGEVVHEQRLKDATQHLAGNCRGHLGIGIYASSTALLGVGTLCTRLFSGCSLLPVRAVLCEAANPAAEGQHSVGSIPVGGLCMLVLYATRHMSPAQRKQAAAGHQSSFSSPRSKRQRMAPQAAGDETEGENDPECTHATALMPAGTIDAQTGSKGESPDGCHISSTAGFHAPRPLATSRPPLLLDGCVLLFAEALVTHETLFIPPLQRVEGSPVGLA
jgi:hypothetical protein